MKRDSDRTGLHHIPSHEEDILGYGIIGSVVLFILFVLSVFAMTGCVSKPVLIGECVGGKVTWSDGTSERCKILTDKGSI